MKKLFFLILVFLPAYGFSQEIPGQYLSVAAENNPGLKALFNEYMAALEQIPQVKTLPDPRLAFGFFIRPVETKAGPQQAKISFDQLFPWFGSLKANADVASQQAKAKYELFEETRSRLFWEVKNAYYDLYFTQKAIDITLENINILNSLSRLSLSNVGAGSSSSVDQLRIDMDVADMENQLALLKNRAAYEQVLFNNLLNVDNETPVIFPVNFSDTALLQDRETVMDSILRNNHQLRKLDFDRAVFQSKEVIARKQGAPSVNIGFDYIFIGESDNPGIEPGLSGRNAVVFPRIGLTIPLYRKKYKAMVRQTVYRRQAVSNRKTEKINVLETLLEKVFKDYDDARRRLKLYQRQTVSARQAMQILQADYANNNTGFEEVLRMEKRILKYDLELEKAKTDINAARAFIEYLTGR